LINRLIFQEVRFNAKTCDLPKIHITEWTGARSRAALRGQGACNARADIDIRRVLYGTEKTIVKDEIVKRRK